MSDKRSKTAVHFFSEDGFIVRGVTDPFEAYRLALEEAIESAWDGNRVGYWAYDAVQPETEGETAWPDTPEDIAKLADEVWDKINNAEVKRGRIVPTRPDDPDYAWLFWPLAPDAKGPGVFTAVVFR